MRYTIPMTMEQTKELMHEALKAQKHRKRKIGTDNEADALHDITQYLLGIRRALIVLGQQDICDINDVVDEWLDEEE